MSGLRPINCPHCNGAAFALNRRTARTKWRVRCEACGCQTDDHETHAFAVTTWNRRVAPKAVAEIQGSLGLDHVPLLSHT